MNLTVRSAGTRADVSRAQPLTRVSNLPWGKTLIQGSREASEYRRQTEPVSNYYRSRGLLKTGNGLQPIDVVTTDIARALASFFSRQSKAAGG